MRMNNKFGECSELRGIKLKNWESEAIRAGRLPRNCLQATPSVCKERAVRWSEARWLEDYVCHSHDRQMKFLGKIVVEIQFRGVL